MKIVTLAALTAGLALAGSVISPTAAVAAPKPKPVTVKVDVDGDGKKDTIKISRISSTKYKVAVTTAKKRTAAIKITSTIQSDWGIDPYWGAAKLDKVKGHELLLATGGSDGWTTAVLTWRNNKLVRQAAPKAAVNSGSGKYAWYSAAMPDWSLHGFRLYTKKKVRYVERYNLFKMGTPRWEGTIITSKWTAKGWKKVGKTKTVSLTDAKVKKYPGGFTGAKIVARP